MPIWYTFYTFICLREQIFKNSIAREASFQEALALAERREVEKKGSILPLPHQAYPQVCPLVYQPLGRLKKILPSGDVKSSPVVYSIMLVDVCSGLFQLGIQDHCKKSRNVLSCRKKNPFCLWPQDFEQLHFWQKCETEW